MDTMTDDPAVRHLNLLTPDADRRWYETYVTDRRARNIPTGGTLFRGEQTEADTAAQRHHTVGVDGYCIHGHAMEGSNVYTSKNNVARCRQCKNDAKKRWVLKQKGLADEV